MDESEMILRLTFRLQMSKEDRIILSDVANRFFKVQTSGEVVCAVSYILQLYGVKGCQFICRKIKENPGYLRNVRDLDDVMY